MREKLIELIGQAQDCGCDVTDVVEMNYVENEVLADHLIANGVTIPVRCKDCKLWIRNRGVVDSPNGHCFYHETHMNGYDFCSYGERKDNG